MHSKLRSHIQLPLYTKRAFSSNTIQSNNTTSTIIKEKPKQKMNLLIRIIMINKNNNRNNDKNKMNMNAALSDHHHVPI